MLEMFFILLVTLCTLSSQLILKRGVATLDMSLLGSHKLAFLLQAIASPYVLVAIGIQGCGFLLWILVVSRVKLGVAFAISGSFFYLLIAFSSWLLYGERISPLQWAGLILISVGVALLNLGSAA
ncbi:DMT family transporter [Cupriavidus pinatubonensis]|uniref:4-amino-4-deoxy-L-arabinose-phosphoundecaprenol flippase subunit ArnE n=1 Tax=Cupriavidus pinatubonensis TaxID=248026 RepID=A0ABN7Z2N3_9BURK|nr:EamA family transporter [Cupriavidus pinatubonensis]CAG9180234.1 4-amino-4-deoxy-L-arabinose-phosphoundecaprenol flippase subunit ArnE [Cupriavidus pinatubonensis]